MRQTFRHLLVGLAGALALMLGMAAANAQPYPYWQGPSGYYYNGPAPGAYGGPQREHMVRTPG
jgi:hypothetical protein